MKRQLQMGAILSLVSLIFLCLIWEGLLAPLKPGGSLLILKVLPLLIPLHGVLRGNLYTYQWSGMLILLYFTEGTVRSWSEHGISAKLATIEICLSVIFFICAIFYARLTRKALA